MGGVQRVRRAHHMKNCASVLIAQLRSNRGCDAKVATCLKDSIIKIYFHVFISNGKSRRFSSLEM